MKMPSLLRAAVVGAAGLILLAPAPPAAAPSADPSQQAAALIDEYWQLQLADDIGSRLALGLPIERLPDVSEEHFRELGAAARRLLERLERIDRTALSHEDWISLAIIEWQSRQAVTMQDHFWLLPEMSVMVLPLRTVNDVLGSLPLREPRDLDAYLALARQYPGLVRMLQKKVEIRRGKGIVPSRDLIDVLLPVLRSYVREPEKSPLWVGEERLAGLRAKGAGVAAFQEQMRKLIAGEVNPALTSLAAAVEALRPQAPERTGLGQYPGGEAAYRALVRYHTTLDVTPEQVHQRGIEEVARINARMAEVRERLGFRGTKEDFHRSIRTDGRFLARTPEEVGERLMAAVRRIEPRLGEYFLRSPKAPYGVRRLSPALEGGTMTFGYYQVPTPLDPGGYYFYNGSQLDQRPLMNAAALIYHELLPGHHFQINLQRENESLPPFRRMSFQTAFVEGWSEYASELGIEMGLYQDPNDLYGRLGMDMFLSTRLVVDTGMNLLGWPREKAIRFMLDNALESETQIRSETLRYSADIPGQALAYKMGSGKIWELRRRAERELGPRFDIRRFHEAVIGSGSMPLTVLEQHIEWWIGQEKARG
jgi:uncharacterized protein (DUF885 family)